MLIIIFIILFWLSVNFTIIRFFQNVSCEDRY